MNSQGELGDVNNDGGINVLDVVMSVGFILGTYDPTEYEFWASDINGDDALNVLDVVMLVDIILNG